MAKNPKFGPFWAQIAHFWAKTFFFRKSENVTFLDLLKANLMQKIRKQARANEDLRENAMNWP